MFSLMWASKCYSPVATCGCRLCPILKGLIGVEYRDWPDCENNGDQWFCNKEPYTAKEQRILITWWAGRAWEKLS